MGYREADIRAFEEDHMVHASELELEPDTSAALPPAKRAQPRRRAR